MNPALVESRIERVKVYHKGARVERVIEISAVDAASLPDEFEIAGLPLALEDASVRVKVNTPRAEFVVSQARVGLHVSPRAAVPKSPEESELLELEQKLERVQAQLALSGFERALLGSIEVPKRPKARDGGPPPASPIAARVALETFTHDEIEQRLGAEAALVTQHSELRARIIEHRDAIERAHAARRVNPEELSKTVIARLERKKGESTKVELSLSYFVPGASWAPQYQLRIARTGEFASIQLRAVVAQASGEDWRGVKLELSTASPTSWSELPKLKSLRIGQAQAAPTTGPGFRPPPRGAATLFGDFDAAKSRASALVPAPLDATTSSLSGWPASPLDYLSMADIGDAGAFDELDLSSDLASLEEEESEDDAFMHDDPAPMMEMARAISMSAPKAAPTPAAAMTPPPAPQRARIKRKKRAPSAPTLGGEFGASEAPAKSAAPQLPNFHDLVLASADSASHQRGKLEPVDVHARYMSYFERSDLSVNFNLTSVLSSAEQRARAVAHLAMPAGTQDVRGLAGHFDYVYKADDRVDVPSDATYHSIPLGTRRADCELKYVTVPREAAHVYRLASLENPTNAPMLPGPAEVYVGDEYVMTANLPRVAPRERMNLGLGVEQAIRCARNTRYEETRSGAAVVATAELRHAIEITLTNNLTRPIECQVRERIPQPDAGAEVVVEELDVEPRWVEFDQLEHGGEHELAGGRVWDVQIAPGESAELRANYVVKIYANNELVGGNRREA